MGRASVGRDGVPPAASTPVVDVALSPIAGSVFAPTDWLYRR